MCEIGVLPAFQALDHMRSHARHTRLAGTGKKAAPAAVRHAHTHARNALFAEPWGAIGQTELDPSFGPSFSPSI